MFLVFVFSCAFLNSERSIPINISICSSGVVLITASSRFFSASFLSAVKRVVSKYRPCSDFASCIFSVRGSCSCCGRETLTCWVLLRYPSSFFSVRIVLRGHGAIAAHTSPRSAGLLLYLRTARGDLPASVQTGFFLTNRH